MRSCSFAQLPPIPGPPATNSRGRALGEERRVDQGVGVALDLGLVATAALRPAAGGRTPVAVFGARTLLLRLGAALLRLAIAGRLGRLLRGLRLPLLAALAARPVVRPPLARLRDSRLAGGRFEPLVGLLGVVEVRNRPARDRRDERPLDGAQLGRLALADQR